MSQQSVRSQSVRKATFATSPTLPFARASSLYTATRRGDLQDGVYIALTTYHCRSISEKRLLFPIRQPNGQLL
jgi:hypothetical protein